MDDGFPLRPPPGRLALQVAASAAVTLGLLLFVASQIDGATFAAALAAFPAWRAVLVIGLSAGVLFVRAARAQLLLPAGAPYRGVLSAVAISFLISTATPLRVGVVVRPWILKTRCGVPFGTGVAGIVAERLLDLLSLLVVVAYVGAVALPRVGGDVLAVDVLATGLVGGASVGLLVLGGVSMVGPDGLRRRFGARADGDGVVAKLAGAAITFAEGARGLTASPGRTLAAAGLTAAMACTGLVIPWIVMGGFGVAVDLDRLTTFWVAAMTAVAAVPTPGSFGAYEAAGMAALSAFDVAPTTGAAVTLVVHLAVFLTQVVLGGAFFAMHGLPTRSSSPTDAA